MRNVFVFEKIKNFSKMLANMAVGHLKNVVIFFSFPSKHPNNIGRNLIILPILFNSLFFLGSLYFSREYLPVKIISIENIFRQNNLFSLFD